MTVLLISLLLFLLVGVPVAYAIGLSALAYFLVYQPVLAHVMPQRMFAQMDSYTLIALPMFIMMGLLMNSGGITRRLIDFSLAFVGRLRGGLGLVNVFASMIFGGISGSSSSDTASIGSVLIPEMKRRGYSARFASGITVASSTMGMIIPPSIPMVLYAIVAQESVGRLFLGGLIPGVLIGVLQIFITLAVARKYDYPRESTPFSLGGATRQTWRSLPVLLMPIFVVGSVVGGIATPTESAGLAVAYAAVFGFYIFRELDAKKFWVSAKETIMTSARIMIIIGMSGLYLWILALERIPEMVAAYVVELDLGVVGTLMLVNFIVLLAGTFIDVSPAILLLTPVFLPACESIGVSPVHFGVLLVSGLAVGACTPPVGNCLNVCAAISRLSIGSIFIGAAPFLAANVAVMILVTVFPELVLWIPNTLMGEE